MGDRPPSNHRTNRPVRGLPIALLLLAQGCQGPQINPSPLPQPCLLHTPFAAGLGRGRRLAGTEAACDQCRRPVGLVRQLTASKGGVESIDTPTRTGWPGVWGARAPARSGQTTAANGPAVAWLSQIDRPSRPGHICVVCMTHDKCVNLSASQPCLHASSGARQVCPGSIDQQ